MKKYSPLFIAALFLLSCGQNKENNAVGAKSDTTSTEKEISFLPVTSILLSQLSALDTLPVTILQIKTVNKKSDSSWVTAAQLKPMLAPFFSPVMDKNNLVALFKESRFDDQSTAAVTFTYDPKVSLPDSLTLRHWDVYYDAEKNAIRRIYILKAIKENNMPVTQQLTWQMDKWAKIVTFINDKNNLTPEITETKWVWDLDE
jgi:hypothetical protein